MIKIKQLLSNFYEDHPIIECLFDGEFRWGLWYYGWRTKYTNLEERFLNIQYKVLTGSDKLNWNILKQQFDRNEIKTYFQYVCAYKKYDIIPNNGWLYEELEIKNQDQYNKIFRKFETICCLSGESPIINSWNWINLCIGLPYTEGFSPVIPSINKKKVFWIFWISGRVSIFKYLKDWFKYHNKEITVDNMDELSNDYWSFLPEDKKKELLRLKYGRD